MVVCGFETKGKLWLSNSILTPPKQQLFNQIYSRCFKSLSGISNPTIFICIQMCLFGRERERERGCCAVERIKVVGFDGDRLWWQWLLWVDATKVNIKFYSLGFY
jgi:hypothetical protein